MKFVASSIKPFSLPSVPLSKRSLLPDLPGCYFVLAGRKILYIGKANSLLERWKNHHRYEELQAVPRVKIVPLVFSKTVKLLQIEARLIEHFKPTLNRTSVIKAKPKSTKAKKMPYCLLCKSKGSRKWSQVSNASFASKSTEYLLVQVLKTNSCIDYIEYQNCGVNYRVIQATDLKKYT